MTAEPEMRLEPCGGCGETNPSARCIGCLHDFSAAPAPQEGEREAIARAVDGAIVDYGNHPAVHTQPVVARVAVAAKTAAAILALRRPAAPAPVAREALRPVILAFAHLMEAKLKENDWKGGWQKDSPAALMKRLREETDELDQATGPGSRTDVGMWRGLVANEAADVANFAMMVADVCGGLPVETVQHVAALTAGAEPRATEAGEDLPECDGCDAGHRCTGVGNVCNPAAPDADKPEGEAVGADGKTWPQWCDEKLQEMQGELMAALRAKDEADARLSVAVADALRPFAEEAAEWSSDQPDNLTLDQHNVPRVTIGDCRRAATALRQIEGG